MKGKNKEIKIKELKVRTVRQNRSGYYSASTLLHAQHRAIERATGEQDAVGLCTFIPQLGTLQQVVFD